MAKYLLLIQLSILLYCPVLAQTPVTNWGEVNKGVDIRHTYTLIGTHDGSTYALHTTFRKSIFQKFDKDNNLVLEKEADISNFDPSAHVRWWPSTPCMVNTGQLVLVYMVEEKGAKVSVYSTFLDNEFKPSGKPAHLFTLAQTTAFDMYNDGWSSKIKVELSQDRSKIMLLYIDPSKLRTQAVVLDNKLHKVFDQDGEIKASPGDMIKLADYVVSDDGKPYFMLRRQKGKKEEINDLPNYEYQVYSLMQKGTRVSTIDLSPKFISSAKMLAAGNGSVLCAGYYSESRPNYANGTFYIQVDASSMAVGEPSLVPFDAKEKEKYFEGGRKDNKGTEIEDLEATQLIPLTDGNCLLVGEINWVVTTTASNGSTISTFYRQHAFLTKFNKVGVINWTVTIPKDHAGVGNMDNMYTSGIIPIGPKIYVLYADEPKNLERGDQFPSRSKNPIYDGAFLATIDGDGDISRQMLYEHSPDNPPMVPEQTLLTDDNNLKILTRYLNKVALLGVNLN